MHLILTCALFAYGMFTLQRPGFLLDGMRNYWKKFPKKLHEPLFECGVCVCSIWGGIAYIFCQVIIPVIDNYLLQSLLYMPIVLIAATGVAAFVDRGVKAFEKTYGYKPPSQITGEKQWEYLQPYNNMRDLFFNGFVQEAYRKGLGVFEIGGFHEHWNNIKYFHYDHTRPFNRQTLEWAEASTMKYCVVIMGLAFDGDLRVLRELIANSQQTVIEYSDDGISRQQVELLTEGLPTKLMIPEYEITPTESTPKGCGSVTKRKILIIEPCPLSNSEQS